MDQARRGALPLDGHGQGSDGQLGAQVITTIVLYMFSIED
jgi:hypothetical protein